MSNDFIEIKNLDKAQRLLSGIKNGVERATSSAINRSITTIKKDLKKDVTTNYAITSTEVEKTLSVKRANFKTPIGYIRAKSPRLSLYKFFKTKKADGTLLVRVKKREKRKEVIGKTNLYGRPFLAIMKNGHRGIFQRKGKSRESTIQDLKTVSIPQMLGTETVQEYVENKAPKILEKNLDREIDRILKGHLWKKYMI